MEATTWNPPLASSELNSDSDSIKNEDNQRLFGHVMVDRSDGKNTANNTTALVDNNSGIQFGDDSSEVEDDNTRRGKQQPLMYRIWRCLKSTWSGVLTASNGFHAGYSDPNIEDLELPHRYRPESLNILCETTGFTIFEMKRIYRGFKSECPTGLITEDAFQSIYLRFFPNGVPFKWVDPNGVIRNSVRPYSSKMTKKEKKELLMQQTNINTYSHYVFATLDSDDSGVITFEDFVLGLSIIVKGCLEDKLRWMFALYDQDKDGYISREEMVGVVGSVFDLMGKTSDPKLEEQLVLDRVDKMFDKLDLDGDGFVSLEEFLQVCSRDEQYCQYIHAYSNVVV